MDYRREIDGLRAIAVLSVILFHAGLSRFSGGFVGVDVFFVISGYLITSIIIAEKVAGHFSFVRFYERRARRILPALFLVIAASIPFAWWLMLPSDMRDFAQSVGFVSFFSSNILFWKESGYFETAAELKPMLHTWSLAVEEQYYLIFPLALMALLRLGRKWTLTILGLVGAASLVAAQIGSLNEPAAAFFLLPTRAWEMLIGALISLHFFGRKPAWTSSERLTGTINQVGSVTGIALIAVAVLTFDQNTPFPGVYALLPTLGAALIILCAHPETMVGRVLGSRILVGIGLISYSLYLWHQPLFAFARYRSPDIGPDGLMLLAGLALAFAFLSWRYVERPFRDRNGFGRKQVFAFSLVGSLLLAAFGWAGHVTQGFAGRYDPGVLALDYPVELRDKYVWERFNELKLKGFDAQGGHKILIIGDSYAGDLVNALYETGLSKQLQISTHPISAICGNLYLDIDLLPKVAPKDRQFCRKQGWYAHEQLHELMKQADAIWLVSSWKEWQAELLPQSKEKLERDFGRKVLIFGRKDFGSIDPKKFVSMPDSERIAFKAKIRRAHIKTNTLMVEAFPQDFIDVSKLLCGEGSLCHPFTKDGKLITFDGGHLTADGARFYGERLLEDAQARRLMGL